MFRPDSASGRAGARTAARQLAVGVARLVGFVAVFVALVGVVELFS